MLVWSHGRTSRLPTELEAHGFTVVRELHQLRRPLAEAIDVPPTPDGIEIRPFAVGADEDAWVAVNAAAFADIPNRVGGRAPTSKHASTRPGSIRQDS